MHRDKKQSSRPRNNISSFFFLSRGTFFIFISIRIHPEGSIHTL